MRVRIWSCCHNLLQLFWRQRRQEGQTNTLYSLSKHKASQHYSYKNFLQQKIRSQSPAGSSPWNETIEQGGWELLGASSTGKGDDWGAAEHSAHSQTRGSVCSESIRPASHTEQSPTRHQQTPPVRGPRVPGLHNSIQTASVFRVPNSYPVLLLTQPDKEVLHVHLLQRCLQGGQKGWEEQSTNTRKQKGSVKHPTWKEIVPGMDTRGAEHLTKPSACAAAETLCLNNNTSEQYLCE